MLKARWSLALAIASLAPACRLWDSSSSYGYDGYYPPSYDNGGTNSTPSTPRGPQPRFGSTVSLDDAPPPLSGGTLLVSRDGSRAVAADPDRDVVFVVDLDERKVVAEVVLEPHDEPGRVVEGADGVVHVALRRGGAIASISLSNGALVARTAVCPAPRGIAFDATTTNLVVACDDGDVMTLPSSGGTPSRLAHVDRDLRDVVVTSRSIYVSRFHSADVLELSREGTLLSRTRAGTSQNDYRVQYDSPMVAFRMAPPPPDEPDSDPIVVHEEASPGPLSTGTGGYYGATETESPPCSSGSVIRSAVSRGGVRGGTIYLPGQAALPLDVATDGKSIAVVAAGNGHTPELPQVYVMSMPEGPWSPCDSLPTTYTGISGQITSIAFRRSNAILVQSREPAKLVLVPEGTNIPLSTTRREDTGHAIFHSNAGAGAACASCHPEGGDDGRTWEFDFGDKRRTPSLRGTLKGTAPFHWTGDVPTIGALADDVLSGRMSGPQLDDGQKSAFESWLFSIPEPNHDAVTAPDAVARGKTIFERSDVGCATCHSGARFTNGATVDVGTGGAFQVPSLVGLVTRAPYMHTGCAATLKDRFSASCGGAQHGKTTGLSSAELSDLVTYLETL